MPRQNLASLMRWCGRRTAFAKVLFRGCSSLRDHTKLAEQADYSDSEEVEMIHELEFTNNYQSKQRGRHLVDERQMTAEPHLGS